MDWIPWRRSWFRTHLVAQFNLFITVLYDNCDYMYRYLYCTCTYVDGNLSISSWRRVCTIHGGARGSGLLISVIRMVTPSTQVKTSIMQLSVRDTGIRMAAAAYTCRRPDDASNCYYSLIVPNVQPTYTYLHSMIFSLLLWLSSSLCRRHLMGNLARIRHMRKSSSRLRFSSPCLSIRCYLWRLSKSHS